MNLEELLGGESPEVLIMGAMAFAVILLLLFAVAGDKQKQQLTRRVDQIKGGRKPKSGGPEKKVSARRSVSDSEYAALDRLIKNLLPKREQLILRLARAGLEIPLGRYLGVCVIVSVVSMAGVLAFTSVPTTAIPFIGLIAGAGVPHLAIGFMAKRRQSKFLSFFPDAIDLMVRGLKSGLPIGESIKTAGEEVPDPVGFELRRVTDAVRLGSKLEEVLKETAERVDIQDFRFFTVSLAIQSETGGNLAETLGNLSNVLRGRRQLKLKVRAMSSEAKTSAYIIGSLPFVVSLMLYIVNRPYVMKLFTDERGHLMLAAGGLSFLIGTGIMYKMIKFEI